MTPWRVSPVGPRHAAVVAEIHDATIGGGWSVASVTRLIALPGTITLLADRPKDIAPTGFALALMAGEVIDLAAIGVLPEGRRAGSRGGQRRRQGALYFRRIRSIWNTSGLLPTPRRDTAGRAFIRPAVGWSNT